jgi:hypothetical protein
MTPFARKVLSELPQPTSAGTTNNYQVLQSLRNDTYKAGAKVDVRINDRMTAFGRVGWRDLDTFEDPPIPLPSGGGGNASTYVRNTQLAAGMTFIPGGASLLDVRFGWSATEAGKNPAALGSTSALEAYGISGLPSDSPVAGGCRRRSSRRSPISAGRPRTRNGNFRPSTTRA